MNHPSLFTMLKGSYMKNSTAQTSTIQMNKSIISSIASACGGRQDGHGPLFEIVGDCKPYFLQENVVDNSRFI
jgi:hypothetical protein